MDFITGEKIELLCDAYIGSMYNLHFLPSVRANKNKHMYIEQLIGLYNEKKLIKNPKILFIHGQLLGTFVQIVDMFINPFVLIVHNSDENITEKYIPLLNHPKLIHLFGQNLMVDHEKASYLPIGIANSVWKHGNLNTVQEVINLSNEGVIMKKNKVFFNFNINTCPSKRKPCFDIVSKKNIPYVKDQEYSEYLKALSSYQFCICPEGNGVDCHRIWECLYLDVVPICLKNTLYENIAKDYPMILLNKWEDLDESSLNYDDFCFDHDIMKKLNLSYYVGKINSVGKN